MEKPIVLTEKKNSLSDIAKINKEFKNVQIADIYTLQLAELFEITHADKKNLPEYEKLLSEFIDDRTQEKKGKFRGAWVYFPWSNRFVHMLNEADYYQVRTNRNRNLITKEEQDKLAKSTIGIIGLSVGSGVATALAYSGIGKTLKLCEFDTLETSNMNRIRARIDQIGMKKLDVVKEQVYEVNPFVKIKPFPSGLTKSVLEKFVKGEPRPQVIFEIIDSFEMKIHLRALAKEMGIPVIMVTNLGDRVLMDVERYDIDHKTEYFNGRAGKIPKEILDSPDTTDASKHHYAVALAGIEHIPERALKSVEQIGKTLVGRPQLASTVTIAAGFSTYFTKKIILGDKTIAGSWLIDLDKLFDSNVSL